MSNDYVRFLGRPPSLFYKWGLFGLFLLFVIGVVISFKIEVPKKVRAVAEVTAPEASIPVVIKYGGLVEEVYVEEASFVNQGDVLIRMASEAKYEDIITLEAWLATEDASLDGASLPKQLSLGNGQVNDAYEYLKSIISEEYFLTKQEIKGQISAYEEVTRQIEHQLDLCNESLQNLEKQLAEDIIREKKGLISKLAVEKTQGNVNDKRESCAGYSRNIAENKALIQDSRIKYAEVKNNELRVFAQLRSAIKSWKERYLISAKSTGLLTLSNEDLLGSVIMQNEVIGEILNEGAEAYVYAYVPISSIDEIDIGQEVQVIVDGFSLREYGKLEGKVSGIRPTLEEDKTHQRIEISLNNGFTTSKGKTIEYRPAYRAEAIVITERSPILFRLFDELWPS